MLAQRNKHTAAQGGMLLTASCCVAAVATSLALRRGAARPARRAPRSANKSTGLLGGRHPGVYAVRLLSFAALRAAAATPTSVCRLVVSQAADAACVAALRASLSAASRCVVSVVTLPPSGWRGVLRNVPSSDGSAATVEEYDGSAHAVVVSIADAATVVDAHAPRSSSSSALPAGRGRVLCLAGLKYRGNIGTVVRSAVQSNCFGEIWIIESEVVEAAADAQAVVPEQPDPGQKGGGPGARRGATEGEVNYYSMQNAPLMPIRRFASAAAFLAAAASTARSMVAVELGERAVSVFSRTAMRELRQQDLFVVIGAEDVGTPATILAHCGCLLEIPSLSASINVSCAFMTVLTTMMLADRGARGGGG